MRKKLSSSPSARADRGFTLGRAAMERISAVEGLSLTAEAREAFANFDRAGLSADERRTRLRETFGRRAKT